ncbi:Bbp16 family capsid cement protein [Castellaniella sp. FW104-16D08]|uniref:Bbp16 family capsid cement protein n=1 Tax=unclassified Castellaniella TaxID=2617606 RepID=UPI00331507FE
MIIDKRNEFADALALNTGGAGTYLLGNVIDTDPAAIAPNDTVDLQGSEMFLVVQVDTAATSGGAATLQIKLASDAQAAIATDGSATEHVVLPAVAVADLTAGKMVACVKLPSGAYERYLGILQVTGTAAFTAGKINVFLTSDPAIWKPYADNVN